LEGKKENRKEGRGGRGGARMRADMAHAAHAWVVSLLARGGEERQRTVDSPVAGGDGEVWADGGEWRRTKGTHSSSSFAGGSFSLGSRIAAAPGTVDGGALWWIWAAQRGGLGRGHAVEGRGGRRGAVWEAGVPRFK
jgi:hypothetical protein